MSYLINIFFYLTITLAVVQSGIVIPNPIINPTVSTDNELPLYASVRKSNNEKLCSGAIVSKKFVLTTAHCLDSKYINDLKVATGYTKKSNVFETLHEVDSIQFHPKYTKSIDPETNRLNDIAMIKVKTLIVPVEFGISLSPPWMNTIEEDFETTKGFDMNNCKDKISGTAADDVFCFYQKPGIQKRPFHSGSPLVVKGKLAGITLTSRPYITGEPELYVNVFKHLDFIQLCIYPPPYRIKA